MTKGGSIISDTTGDRPVAESSSGSLDSWFTGMVERGELQQATTANYQPEQHETEVPLQQPQTLPAESSSSSVISPSLNQLLNAPQPQASTLPPMMLPPPNPVMFTAGSAVTLPEAAAANSIPEFLYQLTKMLTDNNRDIIEWSNGKIEVHSPHKLESQVLEKYFRHSKFASFQRQLNYFGFRKLAGKGKMAPCSYTNDAATSDIGSLLLIKRKTTTSTSSRDKNGSKKRDVSKRPVVKVAKTSVKSSINPVLAGILYRSRGPSDTAAAPAASKKRAPPSQLSQEGGSDQQALARTAVGRGIRHGYSASVAPRPARPMPPPSGQLGGADFSQTSATAALNGASFDYFPDLSAAGDSLSQLTSNYRNSLNDLSAQDSVNEVLPTPLDQMQSSTNGTFGCFLSRDSSLIDLAMIPNAEFDNSQPDLSSFGMNFVDFPNPEVHPAQEHGATGTNGDIDDNTFD